MHTPKVGLAAILERACKLSAAIGRMRRDGSKAEDVLGVELERERLIGLLAPSQQSRHFNKYRLRGG